MKIPSRLKLISVQTFGYVSRRPLILLLSGILPDMGFDALIGFVRIIEGREDEGAGPVLAVSVDRRDGWGREDDGSGIRVNELIKEVNAHIDHADHVRLEGLIVDPDEAGADDDALIGDHVDGPFITGDDADHGE